MNEKKPYDQLLQDLQERAKELNCLYQVQELLNNPDNSIEDICSELIKVIPPGWQYPDICKVKIELMGKVYQSENMLETSWVQFAEILVQNELLGGIQVFYTQEMPILYKGPFLNDEYKLIQTIADRLSLHILHQKLKSIFEKQIQDDGTQKSEWQVILDMLSQTDPKLLVRLARKMANYLCWAGIDEAEPLLGHFSPLFYKGIEAADENKPFKKQSNKDLVRISYNIFEVAEKHLTKQSILYSIQKWTKEDRSGFLSRVLENYGSSLLDIFNAIDQYNHLGSQMLELSEPREKSLRVTLIRRLLTDQPGFIDIAKRYTNLEDFNKLKNNIIFPFSSHGKLGGKSSGMFIAKKILESFEKEFASFKSVKTPKTWYITSDGLLKFMDYNNLEDIMEQKYKDIGQVRQEYPYVIQLFKNSNFPPEIIKGLQMALEDFGNVPLIIRSSSLLEDRMGAAFAGKYKSLFIANQGAKEKRLFELMDAISEVWASTFGPDPIDYRAEQELLDYHEEMGIMIQEVVGTKVGHYFLPSFAGVGFSRNEFRWSTRIKREDGLIRMVPGLGTRAVDRLKDDYPVLISPGQPKLKVNVTIDEVIRYSPKKVDVINLNTEEFETISLNSLKEFGTQYPILHQIVSISSQDHLQQASPIAIDFQKDFLVVTFDGLISRTNFIEQIKDILEVLQKQYNQPIDIEFAHDGKHLYLLQCRSQTSVIEYKPATIPSDIAKEKIIFSANKYISNGLISGLTHIVYVDPKKYSEITDYETFKEVGKAVGRLNKILPKRQFILMGPGRWGSRGDIKLGVNVTYSDISNTSMLIEIARKTKDYVPDLSFGTHFFQDLVETNIRYLPLYPDSSDNIFNEIFLNGSKNVLTEFITEGAELNEIIRVIDISAVTGGKELQVMMNGDLNKAVALITEPTKFTNDIELKQFRPQISKKQNDIHWQWRLRNVEKLAAHLDPKRFGVKALYVFGSVKNAQAGPASDIDLMIHFKGSEGQRRDLLLWLEGWSLSLSQINFYRTGFKTDGLLDIHIITDIDIKNKTSYAIKIGAVSDPAMPLPIGTAVANK